MEGEGDNVPLEEFNSPVSSAVDNFVVKTEPLEEEEEHDDDTTSKVIKTELVDYHMADSSQIIKTEPPEPERKLLNLVVVNCNNNVKQEPDTDVKIKIEKDTSKNKLKNYGRTNVEVVTKKIRMIFCQFCYAQVPSVSKLRIHLDRQHNIKVDGPPRIVDGDDSDNELTMKSASDALRRAENTPRTTVVLSDSDDDDDDESSDDSESSDSDSNDKEQDSKPAESQVSTEESYLKLKTRLMKKMMRQEPRSKLRIDKLVAKLGKNRKNYVQCNTCWIEHLVTDKYQHLRTEHKRQHTDGEFKVCPFCGMSFLYEHYWEKHLEDLSVPTVPPTMSPFEAEDLLHETHSCPVSECGQIFTNRKCLLFHRTKVHDHVHRCPTCEKVYILYADLRKHIQRVHNYEKRLLSCPVPLCDKSFPNRRGIATHVSHAHSVEEKDAYFTSAVGQPNNKIVKTESDENANNDEEDDDNGNVVANSLPPEIVIRHKTPQTFWSKRNAELEKMRRLLIKKNKFYGPRQKSVSILAPRTPLPSQKQHSLNESNKFGMNKSFSRQGSRTSIDVPRNKPITMHGLLDRRFKQPLYKPSQSSIPPRADLVFDDRRRRLPSNRNFTFMCSFCSRAFRTGAHRDAHVGSTHHFDLTLEKPFICPVTDCDKRDFANGRALLGHIRRNHPPSVDDELFQRSIEEDRLAEAANPSTLNSSDFPSDEDETNNMSDHENYVKVEPEEDLPCEEVAKVVPAKRKRVFAKPTKRIFLSSSSSTSGRRHPIKRRDATGRSACAIRWQWAPGPNATRVREVLANFKIKGGFYCPECPLSKRKSISGTWSVHRHIGVLHPTSKFLSDPGSINVEALKNKHRQEEEDEEEEEAQVEKEEAPEQNNDQSSSEEEVEKDYADENHVSNAHIIAEENVEVKEEVEKVKIKDEEEKEVKEEIEDVKATNEEVGDEEATDSDIITRSSVEGLVVLRTWFQFFKVKPEKPVANCPLCPGKQFANLHNLQRHFLVLHEGSEYLRLSKLQVFLKAKLDATKMSKSEKEKLLNPLKRPISITQLRYFNRGRGGRKNVRGRKTGGQSRFFANMKKKFPASSRGRKRKITSSEEEEDGDDDEGDVDKNIGGGDGASSKTIEEEDDESEEEVAPPPKPGEEDDEVQNAGDMKSNIEPEVASSIPLSTSPGNPLRAFKLSNGKYYCPECNAGPPSPPYYSRPFELLRHISDCHPGSSLLSPKKAPEKTKPIIKRKVIKKVKLTEIKVKTEPDTSKGFECQLCPPGSTQNKYLSAWTLSHHMEKNHPEKASSGNSTSTNDTQGSPSKSAKLDVPSKPPVAKKSGLSASRKPAYYAQPWFINGEAKAKAQISHILHLINASRLECIYCPDLPDKEKHVYPSFHYLIRHLNRMHSATRQPSETDPAKIFTPSPLPKTVETIKPVSKRQRDRSKRQKRRTTLSRPKYRDLSSGEEEIPDHLNHPHESDISSAAESDEDDDGDSTVGMDLENEEEPMAADVTYPCSVCCKVFSRVTSLRSHIRWCRARQKEEAGAGEEDTASFCTVCAKQFSSPRALGLHSKQKHKASAPSPSNSDSDESGEEIDPATLNMADVEEVDPSLGGAADSTPMDHTTTNDESQLLDPPIILEDPNETLLEEKCAFCDEWFVSAQEKLTHIMQEHSTRGRRPGNKEDSTNNEKKSNIRYSQYL